MTDFCTYFDHRYLTRGLALWQSLRTHCPEAVLWVVCLDQLCHDALQRLSLPAINLLTLADLEKAFPELLTVKNERSAVEYFFTNTAFLPLYLLRNNPSMGRITYLDADFFFHGSPEHVLNDTSRDSIVITPHRYSESHREHEKFGLFNVGWVGFRNDERAIKCLEWWGAKCVEWCFDRVEPDRFGDQKYLDQFPRLFEGVRILEPKNVNAAIWNIGDARITSDESGVKIAGEPLVCFHFHGFKMRGAWLLQTNAGYWGVPMSQDFKRLIVGPYLATLAEQERRLLQAGLGNLGAGLKSGRGVKPSGWIVRGPRRWIETARLWWQGNLSLCCCDRVI